jgi:hypothetical protein
MFGGIYHPHHNTESLPLKVQDHLTMENTFSPSARVTIVLTVLELLKISASPLRPNANTAVKTQRNKKKVTYFKV